MAQSKMPRRPAMLDAARADAIIGDEDPAATAAVAHTAAWALMGVGDETFTDADVVRLRETVRTSGVDTIAHVWSRSPEFTLPGALWRVSCCTSGTTAIRSWSPSATPRGRAPPSSRASRPPLSCGP